MNKVRDQKQDFIKIISPTKREIELEVPPEEVSQEFEKVLIQYVSSAKVHGFRTGKAPRDLVKRMFYSEIRSSVLDSLAPRAIAEEFKAHNISPISVPVITDYQLEEGKPFHFKAAFEVWPDFELPEYQKLRLKKKEISIKEEEIVQSLESLRQKSAEYIPREGRGVVDGDYVVAEIQGKDLKTKKSFPKEKVVILAGNLDNEKGVNENLIGLKTDEERNFTISYGNDYKNKKLAGKDVEYRLKVISIKEKKIQEINDEFAKSLGEYENLKDLKAKIQEELLASKEKEIRRELTEEIMDQISQNLSLELPESLVEQEFKSLLNRLLTSYSQQGINLDNKAIESIQADTRKQAEKNLKNHLILKKISEKEGLAVTEEEVDEELKNIAKANNLPLARVVDSFNQAGRREDLKDNLLIKKTVDFLIRCAIII